MRTQEVLIVVRRGNDFLVVHRSPENEAYWGYNADYDAKGRYQVAYLDVLPSGYDEPFTPDKMHAEGTEHGREQAAAEVENLLELAAAPGVDPASVLAMLRSWCADGAAKARERAEQAEQHRAFAERILAKLQAERETADQSEDQENTS